MNKKQAQKIIIDTKLESPEGVYVFLAHFGPYAGGPTNNLGFFFDFRNNKATPKQLEYVIAFAVSRNYNYEMVLHYKMLRFVCKPKHLKANEDRFFICAKK